MDRPAELTITLDKPVVVGSITVSELKLREPIGEEVDKFIRTVTTHEEQTFSAGMQLVSDVSGVLLPSIKKVPYSKLKEAIDYLMGFMDDGPATGERSGPT